MSQARGLLAFPCLHTEHLLLPYHPLTSAGRPPPHPIPPLYFLFLLLDRRARHPPVVHPSPVALSPHPPFDCSNVPRTVESKSHPRVAPTPRARSTSLVLFRPFSFLLLRGFPWLLLSSFFFSVALGLRSAALRTPLFALPCLLHRPTARRILPPCPHRVSLWPARRIACHADEPQPNDIATRCFADPFDVVERSHPCTPHHQTALTVQRSILLRLHLVCLPVFHFPRHGTFFFSWSCAVSPSPLLGLPLVRVHFTWLPPLPSFSPGPLAAHACLLRLLRRLSLLSWPLRLSRVRSGVGFFGLQWSLSLGNATAPAVFPPHSVTTWSFSRLLASSALASLRPCVLAFLRSCVLASLRPCVLASLHHCIPVSPCLRVPVSPCPCCRCFLPVSADRYSPCVARCHFPPFHPWPALPDRRLSPARQPVGPPINGVSGLAHHDDCCCTGLLVSLAGLSCCLPPKCCSPLPHFSCLSLLCSSFRPPPLCFPYPPFSSLPFAVLCCCAVLSHLACMPLVCPP